MAMRGMMTAAAVLGVFVIVALCTGPARAADAAGSAAAALERATGVAWIVDTNERQAGVIRFAKPKNGAFALPAAPSPEDAALAFLDEHKALFGMHDPNVELAVERSGAMADGSVHIRFRQQQGGVPVRGATWTAHFDAAGRLTSTDGDYVVHAYRVSTTPKMTPERVAAAARQAMSARSPPLPEDTLDVGQPALEVYPLPGAEPVLAWEVHVGSKLGAGARLVSLSLHIEDATAKVVGEQSNLIRSFGVGAGPKVPATRD